MTIELEHVTPHSETLMDQQCVCSFNKEFKVMTPNTGGPSTWSLLCVFLLVLLFVLLCLLHHFYNSGC